MTRESEWREEWEVLRAERALARRRWRSAADGLAARARDPLGLRSLVHDHPIATAGVGAAIGALLVKLFLRGAKPPRDGAAPDGRTARPASAWGAVLSEAATSIAVPWLARTLKHRFGWDLEPKAAREPDRPQPPDAESGTHAARS